MEATRSEKALRRGLAYQYWSGLPLAPETEIRVLAGTLLALNRGEADLLAAVMAELRTTAPGDAPTPPDPTPPIKRGSLHYGDY